MELSDKIEIFLMFFITTIANSMDEYTEIVLMMYWKRQSRAVSSL